MPKRMKLDAIRRAKKYTQEYMAQKLGVSRVTYARMEVNPQKITMIQAARIAQILEVDMDDIIFLD